VFSGEFAIGVKAFGEFLIGVGFLWNFSLFMFGFSTFSSSPPLFFLVLGYVFLGVFGLLVSSKLGLYDIYALA
jgi:hypothetical protein